jgi:hypothetical protein
VSVWDTGLIHGQHRQRSENWPASSTTRYVLGKQSLRGLAAALARAVVLTAHLSTALSRVEGTLDFLSKLEHRPGTAINRQRFCSQYLSDPPKEILQFPDPSERQSKLAFDLVEPLARLCAGAQDEPQGVGAAMENHRLSRSERT